MERSVSDQRKPASVYGQGDEPDPRFSLANERTALAWMRTALALVVGGVAFVSVSSLATVPRWTTLIGAGSCLGGGLLAWQRTAIIATLVMVPLVVVNARRGSWVMTVLGSVATIVAGVLVGLGTALVLFLG
jgi:uncharacterized membrane protein YidH (DUF202 family)